MVPSLVDHLLTPDASIVEAFIRGSLVYLLLFGILRLIQKRQTGMLGNTDFLLILLLANAVQNALLSSDRSITQAIVLIFAIIFWNYVLNWLGYHFPKFQQLIHPKPYPLILHGEIQQRNLRKELITYDELISQLRKQGVTKVEEVQEAYIEGDGSISVVTKDRRVKPPEVKRGV